MSKSVFVYTMKSCPFCSEFKEKLRTRGISFIDRDCGEYPNEYEFLVKHTNNDFIPAIEIKDDIEKTIMFLVPNRDFNDLDEALDNILLNI